MSMRVGYAGLGLMGEPMARHLVQGGHDVTVWNRTAAATEPLVAAGARAAATPAELAAAADVVATCLPDGAVVRDLLAGDRGVFAGWAAAGTSGVVLDHSTIDPADAEALAALAAEHGHVFLDAPVSGGPGGAAAGALAVMVGGDADALERVRPVLDCYAATIVHIGGPGRGQIAKLANQICIGLTMLGLGEAFALTQAYGLDPATVAAVLEGATANSVMLQTRAPVPGLQAGMPASQDWAPGFATDFMAKDLDFALRAAGPRDVPVRGTELVRELLARAQAAGQGGLDWTVLTTHLDPDGT